MRNPILRFRSKLARVSGRIAAALVLAGCGSDHASLKLGEERRSDLEADYAARMIDAIKDISRKRAGAGESIKRFNQVKTLGCFDARFTVAKELPAEFRQGLFASGKTYSAQLRFANATEADDTRKDFHGLSIKLHGVEGAPLWGIVGEQDFLLNSYPVLFAADPEDFLEFIEATRQDKPWLYFIDPRHWYSLRIVLDGRERISDPFAIPYWSTTPYRFGSDTSRAVKYSVRPCPGSVPEIKVKTDENFLTDAMHEHLKAAPACFDFMVQFQSDPRSMPIEDASVLWSEAESPFIELASIFIEQGATTGQTVANCEAMSFNPWQSLAAHQPLGGINRTRLPVYSEIGKFRQTANAGRRPD